MFPYPGRIYYETDMQVYSNKLSVRFKRCKQLYNFFIYLNWDVDICYKLFIHHF
jgi:hypothetical protein